MLGKSIKNNYVYSRKYYGPLRGLILDWSGTVIDKYSNAPIKALQKLFKNNGIEITEEEARIPMGKRKYEHIELIMKQPHFKEKWYKKYNNYPKKNDIDKIYNRFIPIQKEIIYNYCDLTPGTKESIKQLKNIHKLKIGLTTGFTSDITDIILDQVSKKGFTPDSVVSGDDVKNGNRPNPYMIYKNMDNLNISPIEAILKVDDTTNGIEEGLEAGCWTVGVSRYSTYMNINDTSHESILSDYDIEEKHNYSKEKLRKACAHYVIDDVSCLPYVVEDINKKLMKGEKP